MTDYKNGKIEALEKLQALKLSGALNAEEFETAKRRILDDGGDIGDFSPAPQLDEVSESQSYDFDEVSSKWSVTTIGLLSMTLLGVVALAANFGTTLLPKKQSDPEPIIPIPEVPPAPAVKLKMKRDFMAGTEPPTYLVTNVGVGPVLIDEAYVNNRDECMLVPAYFNESPFVVLQTGQSDSGFRLLNRDYVARVSGGDDSDKALALALVGEIEPRDRIELKVGQSVSLRNSPSCGDIVHVQLNTDEGIFTLRE